jgi:hypothetical protein
MPIPEIQALDESSDPEQIKAALSSCIAGEMGKGMPQEQAMAMCQALIRDKVSPKPTGKPPSANTAPMPMEVME